MTRGRSARWRRRRREARRGGKARRARRGRRGKRARRDKRGREARRGRSRRRRSAALLGGLTSTEMRRDGLWHCAGPLPCRCSTWSTTRSITASSASPAGGGAIISLQELSPDAIYGHLRSQCKELLAEWIPTVQDGLSKYYRQVCLMP
jgi:hypothetical protein